MITNPKPSDTSQFKSFRGGGKFSKQPFFVVLMGVSKSNLYPLYPEFIYKNFSIPSSLLQKE